MQHTELAKAKINLYLNVTSLRDDGFHDIESVMQTIDLYDVLHFDLSPSDTTEITLAFTEPCDLPTDDRNLVVKAAKAFLEKANKTVKLSILLEKNIPMEAGLGGGSTDAAATLRALDIMLPAILTKEQLFSIAASLGSDIPFCLLGGRALCTGRGEKMQPLPSAGDYFGVLATTVETSSTPQAYKKLDAIYNSFDGSVKIPPNLQELDAMEIIRSGKIPPIYNIFETAVLPLCPQATKAKALLLDMGAEAASMSGSGPSVFALTKDLSLAKKMESALKLHGLQALRFTF